MKKTIFAFFIAYWFISYGYQNSNQIGESMTVQQSPQNWLNIGLARALIKNQNNIGGEIVIRNWKQINKQQYDSFWIHDEDVDVTCSSVMKKK